VLAVIFLGERLTGWQVLGSVMIIASVLVLSLGKSDTPT
jgi:drug/metabolite transporter (DMT)-like permease